MDVGVKMPDIGGQFLTLIDLRELNFCGTFYYSFHSHSLNQKRILPTQNKKDTIQTKNYLKFKIWARTRKSNSEVATKWSTQ